MPFEIGIYLKEDSFYGDSLLLYDHSLEVLSPSHEIKSAGKLNVINLMVRH